MKLSDLKTNDRFRIVGGLDDGAHDEDEVYKLIPKTPSAAAFIAEKLGCPCADFIDSENKVECAPLSWEVEKI
jgi:hypothetical protein